MSFSLEYRHGIWECVWDGQYIRVPDYYFEKYKQEYFKQKGIPLDTLTQLREEVDRISKCQWEAFLAFRTNKEFWLEKARTDKNILVLPAPKSFPFE